MTFGPMKGHVVYFAVCGPFVKVGYASNVYTRLCNLQVGNPRQISLVMTVGYDSKREALKAEAEWRLRLAAAGKRAHGEWVELEEETKGSNAPEYRTVTREFNAEEMLRGLLSYHHGLRANLEERA